MLLIHIGAPKTASTLLHRILHDNRAKFAAAGLTVPEQGWTASGGHMKVRQSLMRVGDGDPEVEALRAQYRDMLLSQTGPVVVTTETFWTVSPQQILRVYPQAAGAHILMILRAQSDLIVSHYLQKVKSGVETRTLRRFAGEEHDTYDFAARADAWAAAFGKERVHILVYEDLVRDGGVIPGVLERFSQIFGIETAGILTPDELDALQKRRVNERLPEDAYPYYSAISQADCAPAEKVVLRRLVNENIARQSGSDAPVLADVLDGADISAEGRAAVAAALSRHYAPVRDLLAQNRAELAETQAYIEQAFHDSNAKLFAGYGPGSPEARRHWGVETE